MISTTAASSRPENVTTQHVDDVHHFANKMGERGEYDTKLAKDYSSALRQLSTILAEDEAADPVSLLAGIDDLGRRWGVRHKSKPATIKKYLQRARTLLADLRSVPRGPRELQRPIEEYG